MSRRGTSPKRQAARRRRRARRTTEPQSAYEILTRLLASRIRITVNGEPQAIPAIRAIMLQLRRLGSEPGGRAAALLARCQAFAARHSEKPAALRFVESDYTRELGRQMGAREDG